MKAWFVSDIHIQGPEDSRLRIFETFLEKRLSDQTTHLFLVGDIFDLWVGGDDFFKTRYQGVVDRIQKLRAKNVEIIYFEGNHDLHLQKMWSEELHCRVLKEACYFDLGKFRVRVEHGDQMNPNDTGYIYLRAALRTPAVEWLADRLPGSLIQKFGHQMSRSSRKWTSSAVKARDEAAIRLMIHTHAEKVYQDDEPFDLIISGHVHVHDDYRWKDPTTEKEIRSINLGCWKPAERPKAFCVDENGGQWVELELL